MENPVFVCFAVAIVLRIPVPEIHVHKQETGSKDHTLA